MGCIFFKTKIKSKPQFEKETLSIKTHMNKVLLENSEELKKKGISINQGTFIGEKKYNDFLKEYDILEFIGKGN